MKLLKLSVLLLLLLAVGCFDSNIDDCPPTLTVCFSLKDVANNEVFPVVVNNVELFIYNSDGKQVSHSNISKNELNVFAGKRLVMESGTYSIVAWANTTAAYSKFFTNEDEPYLDRMNNYLLNAIAVNGIVDNGDPLYYAPKAKATPLTVVVPAKDNTKVTAEMRHAHVKLEITVEGYKNEEHPITNPLKVEITELSSRYDFEMKAHGDKLNYLQYAPNINLEDRIYTTFFNIPVFDNNTTTQIRITNSAGQSIIPAFSLKEILGDVIDLKEIRHIPIKIIFTDFQVEVIVELPGWGEGIVKPNI
jgi:hypothetical protein